MKFKPTDIDIRKITIQAKGRKIPALILSPQAEDLTQEENTSEDVVSNENTDRTTSSSTADNSTANHAGRPGVLWIHGGGYFLGMKEMAYMGRAKDLVRNHGAVVITPDYRLALKAPYPAAIKDCYQTLLYLKRHAKELGVREDQIMVGGESAGGGLTAALCILARDRGEVNIAYQMPLYPMLDNLDTDSSRDNHGKVWNTKRNHLGWKLYLRKNAKNPRVSPYAAAARAQDLTGLPPAYTWVGTGEPFYRETLDYVQRLKEAGVPAEVDVYETDVHAFDMVQSHSELSEIAIARFNERFAYAVRNYFR